MSTPFTDSDIEAIRKALRTFLAESIGDRVYDIRERECLGWDGPRVKAWGEASVTLSRLRDEGKL